MPEISQLFIYPVKSLRGISVQSANVTDRGLQYDRRFLLIDENNRFFTQREFPAMALLHTAIKEDRLLVFHKNSFERQLSLPLIPHTVEQTTTVRIWDDKCEAQFVSEEADKWFSSMLPIKCRLVYMPDAAQRKVDEKYALNNDIVNFSDGYPLLIFAQASLDDLNTRLSEPVPVDRFRPNIVFTGARAFEEDRIKHFNINQLDFYCVKPSARCVITTTNQETGIAEKEPLKTLASYRSVNNKVYFGQNVLMKGEGKINVGDPIEIIKQNQIFFI